MLLSLLALCIGAGQPLEAAKPVIDRGEVRIGPPLVETFTLTNRSPSPITISDVKTSCGCLAPTLDRHELKPGESAQLKVEINTLSQPAGPIGWPVRVFHSDGVLDLALRAKLISEVRVEPAAVSFQVRQPRSVTITINDTRAKPFRVIQVGTTSPQLKAEVVPGYSAITQIKLTATPDGPAGTKNEVVWIATDDPLYPQIRVPVSLTVQAKQRVNARPRVVPLSAGDTATVQLRDSDGEAVIIDRVVCDGPIQITHTTGPGLLATLKVTVNPQWDGTAWTGKIHVYLRGPVSEVIAIPADVR